MTGRHYLPEQDAIIAQVEDRALLPLIARKLGKSERSILTRWHALRAGRPTSRTTYNRIWSRAEDKTLTALAGTLNAEQCAARLGRTPTSIRVRAKRLGLRWYKPNAPRQRHSGFTSHEVARMLGVRCSKSVVRWIHRGWLVASKRSVREGKYQLWRIEADAIEAFLREYRWLYDPERIKDRAWRRWVAALPSAEYVGTEEAARRLFYTSGSVAQLCRKGDLPAEKWGAFWKISVRDLSRFEPPTLGYGSRADAGDVRAALAAKRAANIAASKTWPKRQALVEQEREVA